MQCGSAGSVDRVMIIDAFEFARHGKTISGNVQPRELRRVPLGGTQGAIAWSLTGSVRRNGKPFLGMSIDGEIELVCQRCMGLMMQPIAVRADFLLTHSDAEADAVPLDEDDFDVLVGSAEFDVDALLEDEIILSIPVVPKHEQCPAGSSADQIGAAKHGEDPLHPFASLKGLKTKPN